MEAKRINRLFRFLIKNYLLQVKHWKWELSQTETENRRHLPVSPVIDRPLLQCHSSMFLSHSLCYTLPSLAQALTPDREGPERWQEALHTKVQWVQPITKLFFFLLTLCTLHFYTGSFENTCMVWMSASVLRVCKVNLCFCSVLNWHSSTFLAVKDAVVYLVKTFLWSQYWTGEWGGSPSGLLPPNLIFKVEFT